MLIKSFMIELRTKRYPRIQTKLLLGEKYLSEKSPGEIIYP